MHSFKQRLLLFSFLLVLPSLFAQQKTKDVTVYIFLSETCPICQSYTLPLKELYTKYKDHNIRFVGVFPNYFSTRKGTEEFKKKYAIPFELMLDKGGLLTKLYKATITPEVIVVNDGNQILYRGRIDNAFQSIGKRRTVVTSNELADALVAIISKQPIKNPVTPAVGCTITSSR